METLPALIALFYIAANLLLAFHLYHGLWSLFQTFGWDHPRYGWMRRVPAVLFSAKVWFLSGCWLEWDGESSSAEAELGDPRNFTSWSSAACHGEVEDEAWLDRASGFASSYAVTSSLEAETGGGSGIRTHGD